MPRKRSTASQANKPMKEPLPQPDPALKLWERFIGKWDLKGRTLDSKEYNITGWNSFEWLPGGFFIKSEGEINFKGFVMQSLEIIAYDPQKKTFPARVYSSMSGAVYPYDWAIEGDTLIHAGLGARYVGTLSEDGNTIVGGWRPDEGVAETDERSYDAIMTRIK